MSDTKRPLFVERDTYRARRTMDAARLLPVFGAILWLGLLPLIRTKPVEATDGGTTSITVLFLFGVWIVLIALAAVLSRPLSRIDRDEMKADPAAPEA